MSAPRRLSLRSGGVRYDLRLEGPDPEGRVRVEIRQAGAGSGPADGAVFEGTATAAGEDLLLRSGDLALRCAVARDERGAWIACAGRTAYFERDAGTARASARAPVADELRAPMTGVIVEVRAELGAVVVRGELVAVMEAMEMEYRLEAPRDGRVAQVAVGAGDRVELGDLVARLEAAEGAESG